jgi:hypothetical protein
MADDEFVPAFLVRFFGQSDFHGVFVCFSHRPTRARTDKNAGMLGGLEVIMPESLQAGKLGSLKPVA